MIRKGRAKEVNDAPVQVRKDLTQRKRIEEG